MPKHQLRNKTIYCGDNIKMLAEIPDESIDLIYIDPPFNSNRNYETFWGDIQEKRAFDDRFGDAQAYIDYMRPRVIEMFRVLKKTGSFYYHCDWHASHYVKVMLDQIFSFNNFRNEIVWKRSDAHSDSKQGSKHYGRIHDSIFFYTKSEKYTFNTLYKPLSDSTAESWYRNVEDVTGRRYNKADLTAAKGGGDTSYEWKGVKPPPGRYWAYSKTKMEEMDRRGLLVYSKSGKPYMKRYLDESKGVPIQSWWEDISMLRGITQGGERLGYPTQKPLALLERIIEVSSQKGDVVLDAFCGCGTTIAAAQKLGRPWVGIDISPTACRVMAQRLWDLFHLEEGKDFYVEDLPKTEKDLQQLPPFEFQNWACIALGAIPNKTKVADYGIDGKLYPAEQEKKKSDAKGLFDIDVYYPVQVKQKEKAGRPDIDSFETAIRRDRRRKGYFVSFDFTGDAIDEIKRLDKEGEIQIIPVTVRDLLRAEQYKQA